MPGSFFDSNTIIYLASRDSNKAQHVEDLLRGGGTVSVQVLNEVAHVGRRKLHFSWSDLHDFLSWLRRVVRVVPMTIETHTRGLQFAERYGLSTYDALIVAAASFEGCDTLWSEDMHHGLRIEGGPRIANPFR